MASCIVDIEFVYNKDNEAFPQKIYITGMTKNKNTYTKEIFYNFPVKTHTNCLTSNSKLNYGNFDFKDKNQELLEILTQFEYIFVKNQLLTGFLRQIFSTKKNILNYEYIPTV